MTVITNFPTYATKGVLSTPPSLLDAALGIQEPGPRQPVDKPLRPVALVVAPDLVELLVSIARDPAGIGWMLSKNDQKPFWKGLTKIA